MADLKEIDIDKRRDHYDPGTGSFPFKYRSGIRFLSGGLFSIHFMLFIIIMCENKWITYITWYKLLKMAKNYRKRGRMTLKDQELVKFLDILGKTPKKSE